MHPYREPGTIVSPPDATASDDRTLGLVLVAFGALRIAIAVAAGEPFGVEATVAILMIGLGIAGLARRPR